MTIILPEIFGVTAHYFRRFIAIIMGSTTNHTARQKSAYKIAVVGGVVIDFLWTLEVKTGDVVSVFKVSMQILSSATRMTSSRNKPRNRVSNTKKNKVGNHNVVKNP